MRFTSTFFLFLFLSSSCSGERTDAVRPPAEQSNEIAEHDPAFEHTRFKDPVSALESLLQKHKPRIVGFGEFHQTLETRGIRSTIARFNETILPAIADRTSDLVVETWVSEGNCGETERAVVKEVDEISKRPKETEDENLALLKKAKKLGIQPHILNMRCEDYDRVHRSDGGVDYVAMLELVARRLGEKGSEVSLARKEIPQKMVGIFCGAIHNDVNPSKDFESFSFAKAAKIAAGGRYLEVDLYVPEFVLAGESAREEPWFELVSSLSREGGTHLIKTGDDSYIILLGD